MRGTSKTQESRLGREILAQSPKMRLPWADIVSGFLTLQIPNSWIEANSVHPWSITVSRYDEESGTWIDFETTMVDKEVLIADGEDIDDPEGLNAYYTAMVPEFSTMAVSGAVSVPTVKIKATDLNISSTGVEAGRSTQISAKITNVIGSEVSQSVSLFIDNSLEQSKSVRLAGNASRIVTFQVTPEEAGIYEIRIDKLISSLTVSAKVEPRSAPAVTPTVTPAPAQPVTPTVTPTAPVDEDGSSQGAGFFMIAGVVTAIVALLLGSLFLFLARRKDERAF